MAKKNRSVKPAIQGIQQDQEQQLDELIDSGDVSESNEGTLSGDEEVGAVDGDPAVGEADAEGSDQAASEPPQEEGLVGDTGHDFKSALLEQSQARMDRPESASLTTLPEPEPGPLEDVQPATFDDRELEVKAPPVVEVTTTQLAMSSMGLSVLRSQLVAKVGADAAAAWSRDQILLFLEKGVYPEKTSRGNWIYDARRTHRVGLWNSSEIIDFVEGRLRLDRTVDESQVWEEVYLRYKVPTNWTIDALKQYVCSGTAPEYTVSGVLLLDRMRDQKQAPHLTFREIRAALLNEIQTKFTRDELMTQYRKRLGIGSNFSEERLLAEMQKLTEVSMDNTILRAKLEEFKAAITRNPATMSERTAGDCQGMLYKAMRAVIKREHNEFVEGWNIILDFVNVNYAALFTPEKARRGWSNINLGKGQLQLFEDLLTLVIHTREPGNRAAQAKVYNLEIVLRHLPDENERQNLFVYYGI